MGKRVISHANSCGRKFRYHSKKAAYDGIKRLVDDKRDVEEINTRLIEVYRCKYCDKYHFGHRG